MKNSCLATREDPRIQEFISLVRIVGEDTCKLILDRRLYCAIFNGAEFRDNQVFVLRPAKPRELSHFKYLATSSQTSVALIKLKNLSETAFPEEIANFRIFPSKEQGAQAFLVDVFGRQSESKPVDYFRPKSLVTFRTHCLNLNVVWIGANNLREPFYRFCLDPTKLTSYRCNKDSAPCG